VLIRSLCGSWSPSRSSNAAWALSGRTTHRSRSSRGAPLTRSALGAGGGGGGGGGGKADYCRVVGDGGDQSRFVSCTLSTGTGFGATFMSPALDWGYEAGQAWVDVIVATLAEAAKGWAS
jgi:hypothetical protein